VSDEARQNWHTSDRLPDYNTHESSSSVFVGLIGRLSMHAVDKVRSTTLLLSVAAVERNHSTSADKFDDVSVSKRNAHIHMYRPVVMKLITSALLLCYIIRSNQHNLISCPLQEEGSFPSTLSYFCCCFRQISAAFLCGLFVSLVCTRSRVAKSSLLAEISSQLTIDNRGWRR